MDEPDGQMQFGTVVRLNPDRGFGYVLDATETHSYIFVVGKALSNVEAGRLRVGARVRFRLRGQGRVEELMLI
ncbi:MULTISPECIES: cold-shock protein [unclassified Thiomonas]|uniref:cold-shock protein n=1 Tax=unclassified Thiomonas TaxID=2625466 RepID=UPI0004DB9B59|nr:MULTISPECIES: hypothetical protein [unclassified Thiomonas]CDW93416.1 conserved hypothetical protein [Thiomonas sp. CB2]VDY05180.1 conserved protein of unknown function [Thiomonas sp. Bio17B3]VDY07655.1 conserved protein of unknown function [Thiomonas sp. Sup16B3]VDY13426.1 conserved protein of unknown function [Thiomonas sp. OC7]VDY17370.1 conserved protein of unknown function [Thiomonas sp. CB2]